MAHIDIAVDIEPHQHARGMFLAPDQRLAPDEIVRLGLERHGKADPGLERVGLVAEIIAGKDQPSLDPHHVQRLQPHRADAMGLTRLPHRVEHRARMFGMAEDLVSQLAGIAGAADHHRHALIVADPGGGKAEPAELFELGLMRRGPDHLFQQFAAFGPLHGDIVLHVGRRAYQHLEPQLGGLFPEPLATVIRAADPAEIVLAQAEHGAVVDHAAMGIAHGGIDDAAHRQGLHVTGKDILAQRLAVGAGDLELAQCAEVKHHAFLAAGMIFLDRACAGHAIGQPEAVVFDEILGEPGEPVVKACLFGHFRFRVGGGPVSYGALKGVLAAIGADMDVGRVPAIGGRGIVGTGRADTDQIGQRPQQHIIARARPGFVGIHHPVVVQPGIEEEVDRHPAGPPRDPVRRQRGVEIVRTVDVAGIADIVVILGGTGQRKGIVAPAGVLDHLNQRLHLLVIVFRVQTRHRIGMAHQCPGGGHVQRMGNALVQLARGETLEIGALAPVHIEDLDIVAGLDEIGLGSGRMHPDIGNRIGQRVGQFEPGRAFQHRAADEHGQRRGGVLRLEIHDAAGGRDDHDPLAAGGKAFGRARRRAVFEKMHRARLRQVQPARLDPHPQASQRGIVRGEQRHQPPRRPLRPRSDQPGIETAKRIGADDLAGLATLGILDLDPVAGFQPKQDCPRPRNHIAFGSRRQRKHPRLQDGAWLWRSGDDLGVFGIQHVATPIICISGKFLY